MKTIKTVLIALLAFTVTLAGCGQTTEASGNQTTDSANISVYYFHFNSRCATCRAIESEAKTAVGDFLNDDIGFTAYNLDEKAGEAKGKELGVSGQTLLIMKGDKKIDLTREGFLYARTNPEKFRQVLNENIKSLL